FANAFGFVRHRTPSRFERRNSGLPTQCVSKYTSRHHKAKDIFRDIIWLNNVLRILLGGLSPAAQFYVQLTSDFIGLSFIKGVYSQDCGWLEISAILHDESISAISEASG